MQRRGFFTQLGSLIAGISAARNAGAYSSRSPRPLLLQESRIAGSHHYDCSLVLSSMRARDPLTLIRQTGNPYDHRAVEVYWNAHKLGYLPRLDNVAVASLLDRGEKLHSEVEGLDDPHSEWEPVKVRVWIAYEHFT